MKLKEEFDKLEPVKKLLEELGYNNIVIDVEYEQFYKNIKISTSDYRDDFNN